MTGFAEWPAVELLSQVGLSLLAVAAATALLVGRPWRSRRGATALAAAIGVPIAYLISELTKVVFAQPRPCSRWTAAVECPPPGDWSLPSNHAVLAFAAVVVIAFALRRPWLTWVAIALAVIVSVGRIMQGAHYLHDVAAGAVLGIAVPLAFAIASVTVVQRLAAKRTRSSIR